MLQIMTPDGLVPSPADLDADRVDFRLVHTAHRLRTILALLALGLCAMVFTGHLFSIRPLYQPVSNGGGTHPLTVVMISLLGLVLLGYRPARRLSPALFAITCIAMSLAVATQVERLILPHLPASSLFLTFAMSAQAQPIQVGANTATCVIFVSMGLLTQRFDSRLGFAVTGAGLFPPTVSCLGYAYDVQTLHGATSPITAAMLLLVAMAAVTTFAHKRALRVLLRGDISGRLARWQILIANLFIILCGFVLSVAEIYADFAKTAVFVGIAIWFVTSMVIVSAQIHEKADHQRRMRERRLVAYSVTEPLTGLANRRAGQEFGEVIFRQSRRSRETLSAMMIDIDHFKQVNDLHGHAAGDDVLCQVARVLARRLRRSDLVVRWGGEEFMALLPGAEEVDAKAVAEEIRTLIAAEVRCAGLDETPVTVSIGVAARSDADTSLDTLLERTDAALYSAKASGRNRVVSCSGLARQQTGVLCGAEKTGQCGQPQARASRGNACDTCILPAAPLAATPVASVSSSAVPPDGGPSRTRRSTG